MSLVNITVRLNHSYSYCQFEFRASATCLKKQSQRQVFQLKSRQVIRQVLDPNLRQEIRTGFSRQDLRQVFKQDRDLP